MSNPKFDERPAGWRPLSSKVKLGLARNINAQAEFAAQQNVNGRFDFVGPVFRGDLLSPQFLLRPILIRTAARPQPQRGGVVTEVPNANPTSASLSKVRLNSF